MGLELQPPCQPTRGRQVNPFVDNADPRNLRYGNPFLLPEYTDGLELGHQLTTKALTRHDIAVLQDHPGCDPALH